jgi:hypothetical protein
MTNIDETHMGKMCGIDGTKLKNSATGKCCECENYSRAVMNRRIVGTPGPSVKDAPPAPDWYNKQQKKILHDRGVESNKVGTLTKQMGPSESGRMVCGHCKGMGIVGSSATKNLGACAECLGDGWVFKKAKRRAK